jgi:hypothetical protein
VTEIEGLAFKGCTGLEHCLINENSNLVEIGEEAFAGCYCLRSFYVPKNVARIGANCFKECLSLFRLKFGSGDTLRRIVRDLTLDEALYDLGIIEISSLFGIEIDDDCSDLSFPLWISIADESSQLTLVRDFC